MRTLPISTAPLALSKLLLPAQRVTVYGPGASSLSLRFAAETACNEKQVVFICGDNRFNPYVIARMARQLHHSREAALRRILVARAFTGYQLDELIRRLKPDEVTGPVILSGICSTFLDEDIPINDAARLFYRSIWRLCDLAVKGMSFLITESQEIGKTRRAHFLTDLFRASNFVFHLDGEHSFRLETRSPRPLAYLASMAKPLLT